LMEFWFFCERTETGIAKVRSMIIKYFNVCLIKDKLYLSGFVLQPKLTKVLMKNFICLLPDI
jgi:hypothetical protein